MKEFYFQCDISGEPDMQDCRLVIKKYRKHDTLRLEAKVFGNWITQTTISGIHRTIIESLVARNTEREKIFTRLMEVAQQIQSSLDELHYQTAEAFTPQLDALAARWQATSGDATGAEGEG